LLVSCIWAWGGCWTPTLPWTWKDNTRDIAKREGASA
jgi:hypothetical protein